MNDLKIKLIDLLKENARYTVNQLSAMTNYTEDDVKTAMKELENDEVIVKYSAIVNDEVYEEKKVQALIEVKVSPSKLKGFDACAEDIYSYPEVKSLYLMSGVFDLAVFIDGKDITDIARFVSEKLSVIDGITSVSTHFILKRYKIEGQVTRPTKRSQREIVQA